MLQAVFGAPAGTRILDPLIKSQMLYQLSYGHIYLLFHSPNSIAGAAGLVNIWRQKFLPPRIKKAQKSPQHNGHGR